MFFSTPFGVETFMRAKTLWSLGGRRDAINLFEDEHKSNPKGAQVFEGSSPLWRLIAQNFLSTNSQKKFVKIQLISRKQHTQTCAYRTKIIIVGFLSTAHASICSRVRQFPAKRSYRQVFELIELTTSWFKTSATVQSTH